jgi:hypothetical protein
MSLEIFSSNKHKKTFLHVVLRQCVTKRGDLRSIILDGRERWNRLHVGVGSRWVALVELEKGELGASTSPNTLAQQHTNKKGRQNEKTGKRRNYFFLKILATAFAGSSALLAV